MFSTINYGFLRFLYNPIPITAIAAAMMAHGHQVILGGL